eukprot:snap_masked-scaffold_2-processed-gene-23.42-mRNA-1 protein AED:1.00 eAED:1.00 QI:0/0/0/0/1/1/2/0/558
MKSNLADSAMDPYHLIPRRQNERLTTGEGYKMFSSHKGKQVGFGVTLSLYGGSLLSPSNVLQKMDTRSHQYHNAASKNILKRPTRSGLKQSSVVFHKAWKSRFDFLDGVNEASGLRIAAKILQVARFFPGDPELQLRCLNAFRKIVCFGNGLETSDRLMRMGVGRVALIALQNHKKEGAILESGCKLLCMLSVSKRSDPNFNAKALLNSGAINCIITSLTSMNKVGYVVIAALQATNALHNGDMDMAYDFVTRGLLGCLDDDLDCYSDNVSVLREISICACLLTPAVNEYIYNNPEQTLEYHLKQFDLPRKLDIGYVNDNNLILDCFKYSFEKRYMQILEKFEGSEEYNYLLVDALKICEAGFYREGVNLDRRTFNCVRLGYVERGVKALATPQIKTRKYRNSYEQMHENKERRRLSALIETVLKFLANLCARKKMHHMVYERLKNRNLKLNFGKLLKQVLKNFQDEDDEVIHFYVFCLINEFVMGEQKIRIGWIKKFGFKYLSEGEVYHLLQELKRIFSKSEKLDAVERDLKLAYKGQLNKRQNGKTFTYFSCPTAC